MEALLPVFGQVERAAVLHAHYFLPLPFCDRALAAAVLDAGPVRPSLSTLLAAVAALLLVCLAFFAMVFLSLLVIH